MNETPTIRLRAEPLDRERFAPYGDVIETAGARHFGINRDTIERFHDLARIEADFSAGGRLTLNIATVNRAASLPYRVPCVERHPLGSQAFIPMDATPMVIVVAEPAEQVATSRLKAFVSNGRQGVNYAPGTWHMPLIGLDRAQRFLLIDRSGPGDNCEEWSLAQTPVLVALGD